MKISFDNTASVKLLAEISRYHSSRKPSKPFKPSRTTFKKAIRTMGAAWISDESEPIVGLLKGTASTNRQTMEFALEKGWVSIRDSGKYDTFYFTANGLSIKDEVASATCAFTARRVK